MVIFYSLPPYIPVLLRNIVQRLFQIYKTFFLDAVAVIISDYVGLFTLAFAAYLVVEVGRQFFSELADFVLDVAVEAQIQLASSLLMAFLTNAFTDIPLFLAIAAIVLCSAGVILMVILPV